METKKEISVLQNKKIIVKPFDKNRAFFAPGHDGRIRYSGCSYGHTLPWKNSTRSYVKIFEDGEQAEFEKLLDLEDGTLNLYKRKGSWWSTFNVNLGKTDKTLDLSHPIQALEYRVLKACINEIASDKNKYNGTQDYYMEDESAVEETSYKLSQKNEEAMDLFIKLRKSDKKMYDLLRVLGKKPNKTMLSNTTALKAELDKIISQKEAIKGVLSIDDFIAGANDPLFQEKVFVLDAIEVGEIVLTGGVYKMKTSGQPLGRSLDEVSEYFNSPKNQDDKLLIQQRIELNK